MMNMLSKIDMSAVTRLTRAGKLSEATAAVLQGLKLRSAAGESSRHDVSDGAKRLSPPIDMIARSGPEGAWTEAPHSPRRPASGARPSGSPDLARAFRDQLPRLGKFPGLDMRISSLRQSPLPAPGGARFEERVFSSAAGSRTYKVYAPSGYAGQPLPVVVMLHGCTQNPDDFAAGTRMNEVAEEQTFLVAYPRQPKSANMQKCWNWFNAGDQRREGGEPALIAGIARQVVEEFAADPARVYVAGLSAGGAAAAIMAATYPDIFAAVGVHSGLACGIARDMPSAFAAMKGNGTFPSHHEGPKLPTIVFHGDADRTVSPVNGDQVFAQASHQAAATTTATEGETPDGMAYTRKVQRDAAGREIFEQWVLHGAGHAWSGGSANGSFTNPRGPDASREMVRFFMRHVKAKAASPL